MPTIVDPATGQVIQLPYGNEGAPTAPPTGPPMGAPMGAPELGGLPPELMGMMGGPMGPAPEAPQQQFANPAEALRDLLEMVKNHPYFQLEQDDADLAQAQKWITSMQDLLAKNQKQAESALGIGPAQKFMMRQGAVG